MAHPAQKEAAARNLPRLRLRSPRHAHWRRTSQNLPGMRADVAGRFGFVNSAFTLPLAPVAILPENSGMDRAAILRDYQILRRVGIPLSNRLVETLRKDD